MSKAALVAIFNHRFEQNLPKLRSLYSARFSNLRFVMPFAHSRDEDVIPVYESSYRFQGFIAQAWPALATLDVDHFVFVGDDFILNPALTEGTIVARMGLGDECAFVNQLFSLAETPYQWPHLTEVLRDMKAGGKYLQWQRELPTREEAIARFSKLGLKTGGIDYANRRHNPDRLGFWRDFQGYRKLVAQGLTELEYPLAWGYSDFVVVPKASMEKFADYCRVFAALGLFVEAAIPTALALACPCVKTEETSEWKSTVAWGPGAIETLLEPMEKSMRKMLATFGPKELGKHPVKLSAFENDLS